MEKQGSGAGVEWIAFLVGAVNLLIATTRAATSSSDVAYQVTTITYAVIACAFFLGGSAIRNMRR